MFCRLLEEDEDDKKVEIEVNESEKAKQKRDQANRARWQELTKGQKPLHLYRYNVLETFGDTPTRISVSDDGGLAFFGNVHGIVYIIDCESGKVKGRLADPSKTAIWALAFDQTRARLITSCRAGGISVWDINTSKRVHELTGLGAVTSISVGMDGRLVACLFRNGGTVTIYEAETMTEIFSLEYHADYSNLGA